LNACHSNHLDLVHLGREAEYAGLVPRFLAGLPLDDLPCTTVPEPFGRHGQA